MKSRFWKPKLKKLVMRYPRLSIVAVKTIRPLRFWPERRAMRGRDRGDGNGRPSLVFFTHYRCASMMAVRRLSDLIEGLDYQKRDIQGLIHIRPPAERERFQRDRDDHERIGRFVSKGRFYAPMRYFVDIPVLKQCHVVLLLRDPRDVLVSRYYSEKYAHVRLDKAFLEHCQRVAKMELDDFVLEIADSVEQQYKLYRDHGDDLKNALVVNYEEMIDDFPGFLWKVNEYAELGRSREFVDEIAAQESFTVDSEDKYAHKRSVKARNFEEKLKPETIEKLNRIFSETLVYFGWEPEKNAADVGGPTP